VSAFAWEVRRIREKAHGVLVVPAGFSPAAGNRARELDIELVDAAKLCRTLHGLSAEQGNFFHALTFTGDAKTPTCPICLNKLTRVQQAASAGPLYRPSELIFQASTLVPDAVDCERLEVVAECEVTFLHEVRAHKEVVIHGHVTGDFLCMGNFTLMPGASMSGSVAARGIDIRTGAEFDGVSRILGTVTEPIHCGQPVWFWRCQHPYSTPECRQVMFEPHL
jgi:hypothetical protein